ncbi:TetR/AcrR family transcriptional regulator [Nonomuraea ceibae]|uniref:TetR/AcrR family transcriptional regulator n=1 Tax=Nonomuraea ceibae TaxID=1935170 RepID=UPI001C5D0E54|nr:TetR/AcrR family transcriptional regulator [Nonomuraea ceibae]
MSQREDLLAAARACLADKGFHRTTARDIAAASGAHLASIGYHFGSKDALMTLAALEAQDEWGDVISAVVQAAGVSVPSERLRIALEEFLTALPRQREPLLVSVQAYAQAPYNDEIRRSLTLAGEQARAELAALVIGPPTDPDLGEDTATDMETAENGGLGAVVHALLVGLSMQCLLDPGSLPSADQVTRALRALGGDRES